MTVSVPLSIRKSQSYKYISLWPDKNPAWFGWWKIHFPQVAYQVWSCNNQQHLQCTIFCCFVHAWFELMVCLSTKLLEMFMTIWSWFFVSKLWLFYIRNIRILHVIHIGAGYCRENTVSWLWHLSTLMLEIRRHFSLLCYMIESARRVSNVLSYFKVKIMIFSIFNIWMYDSMACFPFKVFILWIFLLIIFSMTDVNASVL